LPRLCDLKKGISVDIYEATGNCSKQGRNNSTTWLVMEKFVRQTTRYLSEHSVFAALFISLVLHVEICGAHWEYSLESDSHHHHNQYHERFNEAAIRSRDEHVRHQEEYAEYATRYAETAREHDQDRYEASVRLEEQHHEKHEISRENHWNSRDMVPRGKPYQLLNERKAKRFLRRTRVRTVF